MDELWRNTKNIRSSTHHRNNKTDLDILSQGSLLDLNSWQKAVGTKRGEWSFWTERSRKILLQGKMTILVKRLTFQRQQFQHLAKFLSWHEKQIPSQKKYFCLIKSGAANFRTKYKSIQKWKISHSYIFSYFTTFSKQILQFCYL